MKQPYGFWRGRDGRLTKNDETWKAKRIYDLHSKGLPLDALDAALVSEGILPKQGERWTWNTINRIVANFKSYKDGKK